MTTSSTLKLRAIRNWWPAIGCALLIIAIAAPFWNVPLNRDQGVYATCADLIRQGGVPYEACWDTKGPLLYYVYLLSFAIFGSAGRSPYILNAIVIAASTLVLAVLLTHMLFGRWSLPRVEDIKHNKRYWLPYAGGLLYGVLAIIVRYDMNAQPEGFANFFALLGFVFIGYSMSARWWWLWCILAGIVLASAVLLKYALLLPFGVFGLLLVITSPGNEQRRPAQRLQTFAVTFVTSLLVVLLGALYLLANGALETALTHIYFLFRYFPNAQLNPVEFELRSRPVVQTLLYLARVPVMYLLGIAGIAWALVKRRWYALPVLLYLFSSVVLVWIQQRFTPYHWTVALPAVSIGVALLLNELIQRDAFKPKRALAIGVGGMLIVNAAWFFYVDQWQIVGPLLTGQQTEEEFHTGQGTWDQIQVAQYIQERSEPGDGLWVWGHHTPIYHLAERYPPTRFIYNEPLLMRIRGGHPYREQWRMEAAEAIYDNPPEYILLTTFDRTFFDFQNPDVSWSEIEVYRDFTDHYYTRELTVGRFKVYRLLPFSSRQLNADLLEAVTVTDLIAEFDQATVINQVEPAIRIEPFAVFPEEAYDTILMHSGGVLAYQVDLPDDIVCLRFDATMFPDSWEWGVDGATFAVDIQPSDSDTTTRLYDRYISIAPEDQRWFAEIIDISEWAGESVTLTLSTGPGPSNDFTGDWAGWSQPRIVTPPNGRACTDDVVFDLR